MAKDLWWRHSPGWALRCSTSPTDLESPVAEQSGSVDGAKKHRDMSSFQEGLGRITYVAGALEHERAFLSPLYKFLAVALANATEGAARATVLRITQTEPCHGFVALQALVDGHAPKSWNDPAIALQPILATPKRCKDAKEVKERPTAW